MTRGHSVDFRTYDRDAVARKKINFPDVPKSAALAKNNRKEICFIPSAVNNFTGGKKLYRVRVPVVVDKRAALINVSRLFKPEFFTLQCAFATLGQDGERPGGLFAFRTSIFVLE